MGKALAYLSDVKVPSTFIIAPHNAANKNRADLVLTGVPQEDAAAINSTFTMLDNLRGNNPDIAVRVDFMGGTIDLGDNEILLEYDNFHLYGNGVSIVNAIEGSASSTLKATGLNYTIKSFNFSNFLGGGVYVKNALVINCTFSAESGYGVYGYDSKFLFCKSKSNGWEDFQIGGRSMFFGCIAERGGFYFSYEDHPKPSTQALFEEFNLGDVIFDS